jgi:hypothetical protein
MKFFLKKSDLKNIDLKRNITKFDIKKKTNHKGWNWKTISIKKKIRTTKNNNKKMRTIFDIKIKCQGMKSKDKLIQ